MPTPIPPHLIYQLIVVSSPDISPDGSRLAFVTSQVDLSIGGERSQIQMLDLYRGGAKPFTQGARDSNPSFSPDGATLAFLRRTNEDRGQIWLISANGGEAHQLTTTPGGVTEFAWSPDSCKLAFCSNVDPDLLPVDHNPTKDPRVRVVRRVRYRQDTLGWRGESRKHLFIIGVEGRETRQLTDGDWDDSSPTWSPDGERVAFISGRREDRDILALTEAYVVSINGGEPQVWSHGLYTVAAMAWAPDSSRLVVVGSDVFEGSAIYQGWLFMLAPRQTAFRLTDDSVKPVVGFPPLGPVTKLFWGAKSEILFLGDVQGESFLCSVRAKGGVVNRIAGGGGQATALALDSQASLAVVSWTTPSSPGNLHSMEVRSGAQYQLTRYNDAYFQEHPPAVLDKFTVHRNGIGIQSRVWFPPDFDQSKSYPAVLDIHGGPNGAFYDAFNPIHQVLATAGYIVLAVNPRGSTTYGEAFTMAVLGDWGGEDYLDLMAAVDELTARPYVDTARLGVHGYSYGGYMASWILGHSDRFRAAVVGAPCINLSSMYGTSDIGISFGEFQWGGMRKDILNTLIEKSPLTYAPNVSAPVLLLHGEADVRCPIEQSEQYFATLKRLGKEVEFVRFPDCSHQFLRTGHPKLRKEYFYRTLQWFNHHLGVCPQGASYPPTLKP